MPMVTMDASSSSSQRKRVFLSFRGEETRNKFVDHLYHALRGRGIDTFIDSHNLRKGQVIAPALVTAIENSMFFIIVLSQHYASSRWCLEELVKILECNTSNTERVLPVFYDVDPSDIRKQEGEFGEAFKGLVKKLNGRKEDRVEIWRKALTEVANIAGWDSRNRSEHILIKEIITKVSNKYFDTYLSHDKSLVGMYSRIQEVESLLCVKSLDVRIIGISGMGGIGKTTLAKAVYSQVSHQFESSAFLENVGQDSEIQDLIDLQQKLMSRLEGDPNLNMEMLRHKKVLIVLDNVKDRAILEYLTKNQDSFGRGSRIIVTSRHQNLFTYYSVKYYQVREFNKKEAMEILRQYSLKHELPEDNHKELTERITNYAQGLPLALKVLGSSLFGKKKPEWRCHLNKLESTVDSEINQVLQISYDGLDHTEKNIFLDIACFFKDEDKDHVTGILEACGFFPHCGIGTLLGNSLVTISNNKLRMHDLIQDMGMEVVRQKYPGKPGKWSRLWSHEDISRVLEENMGTDEVEGIFLNLSNLQEINFTSEGFKMMTNLRLLKFYTSQISEGSKSTFQREECEVRFSSNFEFPSGHLRYLYWHRYSLKSLPRGFNPQNLVELNMPYSHIERLWKGKKNLKTLKFMDVSHSQSLEETPDLSRATELERLVLEGCTHLRAVDPSLADLKKLIFLSLKNCIRLTDFPSSIELESLQILILSGCSELRKFPEVRGYMKHLSELLLDRTAIEELPSSIEFATGLVVLDLTNCKALKSLPNSICNLECLETLLLSGCSRLESLPHNIGNLKRLMKFHVDRSALKGLPDSIALDSLLHPLSGLCLLKI